MNRSGGKYKLGSKKVELGTITGGNNKDHGLEVRMTRGGGEMLA